MRVRAFTPNDLAAVLAIQLKCPDAAQWRPEDYLHLADEPGGMILVAIMEEMNLPEIAGFVAFHHVMDEAELRNLAIDPALRRKGIARALVAAGINTLQDRGVRRVFLEVRASNQPALSFYTSVGFQFIYTRRDYYEHPAEDARVMARDIPVSHTSKPIC